MYFPDGNLFALSRRLIISIGCTVLALGMVPIASAQEQDTDEELVEIVVTGTRMRGVEAPVGSSIISLDQDYIDKSNAVSVDSLIKEIPIAYNQGVSEASRGQPGGNGNIVYGNSINLRAIGPFSTLVLIDGHRVVTNSRNVDPSILPTLALERVEIVPDGASAIYGSDAVAGVANLVQRRHVDGGQVLARYGTGDEYDEHLVGLSWGTTWNQGQFFAAYENSSRSNVNGIDRDYFRQLQPAADYRTRQCDEGNIVVGGVRYAIPEGGVAAGNEASLIPDTENVCEASINQDLLPEQEYNNFSFTLNHSFNDNVEVYLDGLYSKRDFVRKVGASGGNLNVPSTNAFFVAPPGTNPASVTVEYSFVNDLPNNDSQGHARNMNVTAGIRTGLPAEWNFEALVSYGDNEEVSQTWRGLDSRPPSGSLITALASSDPATAFDPFGLHRTSDTVLSEISDQVFLVDANFEFVGIEARFDGPIAELPGGTMQLAAGYERQDQTSFPLLARGGPTSDYRCVPCGVAGVPDLQREIDSFYAELLIPITGPASGGSGGQGLDLKMAVRYDDYSDIGSTTNPQFGINWSVTEALNLRASYGESFRAPLIADLYGNSSAMFVEPFVDPTIGGAATQGVFQSGGNPALSPESATTWSVGFDFDLAFLEGGRFSLTYFDVEYENQIAQYLGDRNILLRESEFEGTGLILRGAEAQARIDELFAQGLNVARGVLPVPVTLYVDGRPNNLGVSNTSGIDFQFQTAWSSASAGDFVVDFGGMYLSDYELSVAPAGSLLDKGNVIFNPLKFKARASLSWYRNALSGRLTINHVGSYDNTLVTPAQSVDSFTPIDIDVWLEIGDADGRGFQDGWVLGLNLRNAFDDDPPYVNIAPSGNGSGGYDATVASPMGQVFGVSLRKQF